MCCVWVSGAEREESRRAIGVLGTGHGQRFGRGARKESRLRQCCHLVFILVSNLASPPKGTQRASGRVVTQSFLKPWSPSGACQTGDLAQWPAGREAHVCSLLMKGEPKGEAALWRPWDGPA